MVGNVEELIEEEEEGTNRPGCRSKYSAGEEQRDELSMICEAVRDGFCQIRRDQRDGFRLNGVQPTLVENDLTDSVKFITFEKMNSIDDVEDELEIAGVDVVDVVEEIVEIEVDPEAAQSVWPMRLKGVARTNTAKAVRIAAANGSLIHVKGGAKLEFFIGTARSAT